MTLTFPTLKRRKIEADFSGGDLTSDTGLLLLRQTDLKLGLTSQLSQSISDSCCPGRQYARHFERPGQAPAPAMARGGIIVRADAGLCHPLLLFWCDRNQVDYVICMTKNSVLNTKSHASCLLATTWARQPCKNIQYSINDAKVGRIRKNRLLD